MTLEAKAQAFDAIVSQLVDRVPGDAGDKFVCRLGDRSKLHDSSEQAIEALLAELRAESARIRWARNVTRRLTEAK